MLACCTSCTGFTFLTLLLSAMLYGRGRKVLTLCGGRECSSSDSGVRANKPGDTSLSSWPVLVLLALDKKRELKGRSQTEREKNTRETCCEILVFIKNTSENRANVSEKGGGREGDQFLSSWLCFWCERCFDSLRIQMEKEGVTRVSASKVSCNSATVKTSH